MQFSANPLPTHTGGRLAMDAAARMDEAESVEALLPLAAVSADMRRRISQRAANLVRGIRANRSSGGSLDAFLQEYGLSTKEGVALMCLAEALLRIPDADTADELIADKLGSADWASHLGHGEGLFVNASTWGLMLTGRVVALDPRDVHQPGNLVGRLVKSLGEPVIREAMRQAMRIMGRQFVMGRTIEEALDRAKASEKQGYRYSYDMLGEAARTHADAERYFQSYLDAIGAIGRGSAGRGVVDGPGISVKLSALHPRFEPTKRQDCVPPLIERLMRLASAAKERNIGLCVDSEEADRFDLMLDVFAAVYADEALAGWDGFGLAVQTYQKRAWEQFQWLADLARTHGRRMMVRLVKGAYWDSEVKRTQEQGLIDYPVFTRKAATDTSYLACARFALANRDVFYPQFATHNAHAAAYVLEAMGESRGLEFQRLHGMGEPLYDQIVGPDMPVRVYAPVGSHEDLLAYLVRRLLENGANSSFVNRLSDDHVPVEEIVADPITRIASAKQKRHPGIPLPLDLFGTDRKNSQGLDLADSGAVRSELETMDRGSATERWVRPLVADKVTGNTGDPAPRAISNPADRRDIVGHVIEATADQAANALDVAAGAWAEWNATGAHRRADMLDLMADLLEDNRAELMALATREAGKTLADGIGEVREAADFCRYYAARAREHLAGEVRLSGPTGEDDLLSMHGRGVFVCISPWNFPLAIFTGQVAAALVAGNTVIAKPAEQTPLIGHRAVQLFHQAGVPQDVLQFLPGDGPTLGGALLGDDRVAGVAFTGSTETARAINQALAARSGPIVPLIAETGGQNAMIVDSTALPEQVVVDVIASAFHSAGQRCSALRVLFIQDSVANRVVKMLQGAAETLRVGDPAMLTTDIGPVIDDDALSMLEAHAARMEREGRELIRVPLSPECAHGTFFAPRAFEIDSLDRLQRETFGPILHVIRYRGDRLDKVLEAIGKTGYGLTLGIHTRIESKALDIHRRLSIGNTYINRNMVGAIVGVQPFGGQGLSGTGPKAGGPHYLFRFCTERSLSIDTTASGGNASLVTMSEDV